VSVYLIERLAHVNDQRRCGRVTVVDGAPLLPQRIHTYRRRVTHAAALCAAVAIIAATASHSLATLQVCG